jgi:GcrA cell cycle regulator
VIPVAPAMPDEERRPLVMSVLDLREGHCRWPHGHPGEPGFGFCGHPAPGPYCAHHNGIAYR